jgi:hypothetical protein
MREWEEEKEEKEKKERREREYNSRYVCVPGKWKEECSWSVASRDGRFGFPFLSLLRALSHG